MKNMFESGEIFTAYATIDAGYYMIENIQKELNIKENLMNSLIDKATAYDKILIKEKCERLISILETIIEAKKIIEADYSTDEKLLKEILTLKNK